MKISMQTHLPLSQTPAGPASFTSKSMIFPSSVRGPSRHHFFAAYSHLYHARRPRSLLHLLFILSFDCNWVPNCRLETDQSGSGTQAVCIHLNCLHTCKELHTYLIVNDLPHNILIASQTSPGVLNCSFNLNSYTGIPTFVSLRYHNTVSPPQLLGPDCLVGSGRPQRPTARMDYTPSI